MPYFQLKRYFLSHRTAAEYNGSYEAGSVIITTNIIAITLIIFSPNTNPRLLWHRLDDEEGILVAGGVDADNRALKYNLILAASQSEDLPAPKKVVLCNLCVPQVGGVLLHPEAGVGHPCRHDDRQVQAVNKQSSERNWNSREYLYFNVARTEHGLAVINGIPTVCAPTVLSWSTITDQRSSRSRTSQIPCQSVPPCLTAPKGCNHRFKL